MCRIAGRPSPLRLFVMLLAASTAFGNPADDPKPKTSGAKKATASKSKKTDESKPDESKPKTTDEKKAEEAAKQKDAALKVAEAYIVLLDKQKYGESWETMTADVRKGITRRKWVDALGKTRTPYGPLRARKLNRIQMRATEVVERLDEAWVYTDFQTVEGDTASELIIVVLQNGKTWAVNAYYIGDASSFPKPPAEEEEAKSRAKK